MKRKASSGIRRYRRSGFRQPLYRPPLVSARAARALAPEIKVQTRTIDGVAFATSASVQITDFSRVAGGSEVYQRVGNKVKALGWECKGVLYGGGTEYFLRVACIKLGNATDDPTDAAYNLIYGVAGPTTLTAAGDNLTMVQPLNEQRFKVLYDKTFQWPTEGGEGFRGQYFNAKGSLNHVIKYGSATSNDWDSGRCCVIYWIGRADAAAFANAPTLWAAASLYYTDV